MAGYLASSWTTWEEALMKPETYGLWLGRAGVVTLCAVWASQVQATPASAHPIATAVRHGDCDKAVDLGNQGISSKDGQAAFLLGRMLDEGICVKQDPETAAHYFARGALLGDRDAALDYATKVGLGEGADQNYEQAGQICRDAGVDPQSRLSAYALGYACTLRGVAGRMLREGLPADAFQPGGTLLVEFKPASAAMSIRAMPHVERKAAAIGSNVHRPKVDGRREIEDAWQSASSVVPKPDAARLVDQPVELSLDVDTTLESGRKSGQSGESDTRRLEGLRNLFPGEIRTPLSVPSTR